MREDMKYKFKCAGDHLLLTGSHWKQRLLKRRELNRNDADRTEGHCHFIERSMRAA